MEALAARRDPSPVDAVGRGRKARSLGRRWHLPATLGGSMASARSDEVGVHRPDIVRQGRPWPASSKSRRPRVPGRRPAHCRCGSRGGSQRVGTDTGRVAEPAGDLGAQRLGLDPVPTVGGARTASAGLRLSASSRDPVGVAPGGREADRAAVQPDPGLHRSPAPRSVPAAGLIVPVAVGAQVQVATGEPVPAVRPGLRCRRWPTAADGPRCRRSAGRRSWGDRGPRRGPRAGGQDRSARHRGMANLVPVDRMQVRGAGSTAP